jgi:hypothetical protein
MLLAGFADSRPFFVQVLALFSWGKRPQQIQTNGWREIDSGGIQHLSLARARKLIWGEMLYKEREDYIYRYIFLITGEDKLEAVD